MTQQASTSIPEIRTLRENLARIPSPDNIILGVPEKQLPRLRTVLILFRIVLIIAGIAKLFWLVVPAAHMFLFLLDLAIGTPLFIVFTFLAAWAHARDLHEKFQIEQLRVIPQGDRLLSRALALRPMRSILYTLGFYYFPSLLFGCFNILIGFNGPSDFMMGPTICLTILAFQGPWLLIMAGLMVSITANTVRAVTGARGTMPTVLIEAFGRLLIAMIILIGGVILTISFLIGVLTPGSDFQSLIPVFILLSLAVFFSMAIGFAVTSWIGDALERLDEDLEAHWSDVPLPYHEPATMTS
jgi:hypothetical protein